MAGPIDGVRVLDLTHSITGPYATKLLADYGADVIKVERPGGDPSRRLGPFPGDAPHPEKSGTFFYFNTNKRSVVLDLARPGGREAVLRLAAGADVVVESFRPGVLDSLGLGWDVLHAVKPSLSLVSISNFGQTGPYRDYLGSELVLYGFAGEMYTMGVAEREPVKMFGTAALVQSGSAAAAGIMAALFASEFQGIGQHVDFAITDSHIGGADRRHVGAISFEFSGRRSTRQPMGARGILSGVYPCADGWVEFSAAGGRMDRLREMLNNPEWLADPKWAAPGALANLELAQEFDGYFYGWLYEHTKREIWAKAREARVLCGPLFTVEEIRNDAHFSDRGFWASIQHAVLGSVEIPGRPFIMHDSPWEIRRPPPLLGEHTREILMESGYTPAEVDDLVAAGAAEVR
jgi:crotonobetainyl-CoA:carnitine CoA-transferase CaiB-like acyl-CoA transferase